MFITGSSSIIYLGTAFYMTCTANLTEDVDIPVVVTIIFRKQAQHNTWKLYGGPLLADEVSPNVFQSTIKQSPVCQSDSGTYRCTAIVRAENYTDTTNEAYFSYSVIGKIINDFFKVQFI